MSADAKLQRQFPGLTAKQLEATRIFFEAWQLRDRGDIFGISSVQSTDPMVGVRGSIQVTRGCVSGFSFGATTIAVLKREGLVVKAAWGYRISEEALARWPEGAARVRRREETS